MTTLARPAALLRASLAGSASALALGAGLLLVAAPAAAQTQTTPEQATAGSHTTDPAASSSTAANPNEGPSAADQRANNAAATGDLAPAVSAAQTGVTAQTQESEAGAGADGGPDIVVTGFRRSLESAIAEKKGRDQIVESVSAEDIGKLPDASIAESIARLPGLAAQRVSGRAQTLSIRGLGPDFSTTLLNGREQATTNDNRQAEFDQYPSEVVNQVLVYKTPQAAVVGQGLVGTVDLRTIRPIEYGRRIVSIGGRGTFNDIERFNPDSTRYGYRVNGTYVDQFANDTIGVSLAASYINEPYQFEEYRSGGYSNGGPGGAALVGFPTGRGTSTKLRRVGVAGTIEFRPVPEFTSTFDGFYSNFKDLQSRRGIELPLGFAVGDFFGTSFNPATATVTNGVVTAGTFNGVQALVRNDAQRNTANLYSFGWNNAYKGNDGWSAQLDLSYSRTDRSELSFESYAGTGRGRDRGISETIGFVTTTTGSVFTPQLDYTNPALFLLTDPAGYGGADTVQAGYYNDRRIRDEVYQFRTEVAKTLDGFFISNIRFGMNYTSRVKSLTPNESFVTLPGGAQEAAIPSQYLLGTFDVSYAFNGVGRALAYDPFALLNAGVLTLKSRAGAQDILTKAFSVKEDILTPYLQADIRQSIGEAELTGNIGVQFAVTEQKSTGLVFGPNNNFFSTTQGANYTDALPSVNLSLRLPSDWVFRVAAAREIARPRLDDMRIALSYGVDTATGVIRGSAGNPGLRPYRATAFDATIEKYFGTRGYIALQGFYKDLTSFIYRDREVPFDYAPYPAPVNASLAASTVGTLTRPINVGGGKLYGAELAGTLQLGTIVRALDGFGVTGGGSYTRTEVRPTPTSPATDIPGYSRWVANGTAFFEKYGFNLRGSVRYRSTFLGEIVGFGASRDFARAREELIVDAQIGYDFKSGPLSGLSLYLQGQNLTDEPFVTDAAGSPLQVTQYQRYGRRYQAGATIRF